MKQFCLEEYLANPSRKVVTREGKEARILCTDRKVNISDPNDIYPIVALFNTAENCEIVSYFTEDGRCLRGHEKPFDIFFADNPIPDFKPYDRVLTRGHNGLPWKANLFSNFKKQGDNTIAVCLKGDYLLNDIIPFDESKVGKIK